MRQGEQIAEQAEPMHDLQRGGVDGVAAEVTKKVSVLLHHGDGYIGTREQVSEHDTCRASADDAAGGWSSGVHTRLDAEWKQMAKRKLRKRCGYDYATPCRPPASMRSSEQTY